MKIIKAGVISLCLATLAACSTPPKATTERLICPQSHQCRTPLVDIKTNGDLVATLAEALNTIELCKIENRILKDCINGSN
ncbi:Rz1-like lysis system protein LysC [Gallibacterium anatis]|uniref:Rz1-like lysis system protein LysC n=1 Tax=Gallibacterium anatis TaxID=750 RepID=UPI0012D2C15C|nr:Rz1-like lysis system protein LysC [Gallibacterium anatis]WIM85052.1 Rz1-like lysis system protein LysC [Gallibacterium anatis]